MRRERTSEKRNKKISKMLEGEMSGILDLVFLKKKIDLDGLVQIFCEEHFTPDIVCKLTTRKLGLKD